MNAITWWRKDCKEPIHLVTNIESPEEACVVYAKRFRIETFFRDHKSQGFHIHKSHNLKPDRLAHLLIPACLAYYWVIFLGVEAIRTGLDRIIHRKSRTDLSLFQLGLSLIGLFQQGPANASRFPGPFDHLKRSPLVSPHFKYKFPFVDDSITISSTRI